MTLLSINAGDPVPVAGLARALAALPAGRPVVVMIHGFKFCPSAPRTSPHTHILSAAPSRACWKAISWPRHLRLGGDRGLAIAFGWPARGTIWQAYGRAAGAAGSLARLLRTLHRLDPARPVHLIAHSLGARLALLALRGLEPGTVHRMVLIAPAVFRAEAAAAMDTPAGRRAEVFSVLGRENTLFDLLLRTAFPASGPTLGRSGPALPRWLDLRLDRAGVLAALAGLGHRIAAPRARICHWSGYLRPGIFGLYRALLHRPAETPLPLLRRQIEGARGLPAPRSRIGGRVCPRLTGAQS